jgi:predicted metalloendopeptidase
MTLAQSGIVPDWIDPSVDPCQDFFAYACGGFTKTAQIPADRASWGAIQIVVQDNEEFLRKLLEGLANQPGDKLGTYYAACLDEAGVETAGITPIQPMLDEIAKIKDAASAAHALGVLQSEGYSPMFRLDPQQDFADATQVIAALDQAGIGLPDRDYYLKTRALSRRLARPTASTCGGCSTCWVRQTPSWQRTTPSRSRTRSPKSSRTRCSAATRTQCITASSARGSRRRLHPAFRGANT